MYKNSGVLRKCLAGFLALCGAVILVMSSSVPAQAAFQQATYKCWPGPSGNVCARLFYDSATRVWQAYGAADPNPGKSILLEEVSLVQCSTPNGGCNRISYKTGSGPSTSYQRITTEGRGPACYWYSDIIYVASGKRYYNDSPVAGLC